MRKVKFSTGEYYHLLNRGNNKQDIFLDERDYIRFVFLILHFQSAVKFYNISYAVKNFIRHRVFSKIKNEKEFLKKRQINLLCFVLMPNHFHILAKEKLDHGISDYLRRVQDGYTKYFNEKYKKTGHLFQGPFKAVHVKDNNQLLYLSSYIHKNPKELKNGIEYSYLWSSLQDYISNNRWGILLERNFILDQFRNKNKYQDFIKTSKAKELQDELHLEN